MENLINNVGLIVILAVIAIGGVVYAINFYKKFKGQSKEANVADLRVIAYQIFLALEKKYGKDGIADKMAAAVTVFYKLVTKDNFNKILPDVTVEQFLQKAFEEGQNKLADFLDDGKMDNSVQPQPEVKVADQPVQK